MNLKQLLRVKNVREDITHELLGAEKYTLEAIDYITRRKSSGEVDVPLVIDGEEMRAVFYLYMDETRIYHQLDSTLSLADSGELVAEFTAIYDFTGEPVDDPGRTDWQPESASSYYGQLREGVKSEGLNPDVKYRIYEEEWGSAEIYHPLGQWTEINTGKFRKVQPTIFNEGEEVIFTYLVGQRNVKQTVVILDSDGNRDPKYLVLGDNEWQDWIHWSELSR